MMIKYYEVSNCSVVSYTDNTGENKYCIYVPNNTPVEVLKRYKFIEQFKSEQHKNKINTT